MPTRNVVLTAHHQETIDRLVGSGRYQNASEVVRDGLRLIEQQEAREQATLKALKVAADNGFADIEAGRYRDIRDEELESVIAELGQRAKEHIASGL